MTNWDQLRSFASQCATLGIELPASVVRGLHLHDVATGHEAAPEGALLGLSDDELRDRITEISIRQHDRDGIAARRGMTPGVDVVQRGLLVEVHAAALPELDRIVTDLQPRFAELAAPLEEAAQDYGLSYETTSDEVIDRDFETIEAHRRAKTAWFAMEPIVSFRRTLSKTFGLAPHGFAGFGVDWSVVFAAAENWGADGRYYLEGNTRNHLNWYALASGGIRLNTPAEVDAKIRARKAETDAALPVVAVLELAQGDFSAPVYPVYPTGRR